MSAEARKNCRTQGRYSDKNPIYEDKKTRKSLEKKLKDSPTEKETQEKKFLKRKSDGTKEGTSFGSENNELSLEYQENSGYSFSQLEERKKPIEIKKPGKSILSKTENGESSVLYEPDFYSEDEAWTLFECLYHSTEWLDKSIVIHGVEYPQPRLVAWYGPLPYTYSGSTLEAAEMPECVLAIKKRVEDYLKGNNINVELNSVLLNLYRNNKDSVSWHSDDEFTMGVCPTIASISLGETRKFEMRPKSNRYYEDEHEKKLDEYFVHLNNGSLIVMDGCMQEDWQHRVPKEYHDRDARINLTFRTVYAFEDGSPYSRVNNYKLVDREIPKNPSKIKIDLDEENFPPLSLISNNVNSKTAHKMSEKESEMNNRCHESSSKVNDEINNSEEQWTVETPNKTTSRINDEINASEEEWIIETPVCTKFHSKANDASSTLQGDIATKSPTSHRNFQKRDNVHEYLEEWNDETPPQPKPSTKTNGTACESKNLLTNNFINAPVEEWKDPSTSKSEINKLHYKCYEESAYISQPTPQELNNKSHRDWYDESCNSQILSECNESNQLCEERHEKAFDYQQQTLLESDKNRRSNEDYFEKPHRRTPSEHNKNIRSYENRYAKSSHTRPNRFQSDQTNKYYEERSSKHFNKRNTPSETRRYHRHLDKEEPFYTKNSSRQDRNFKCDEVKSFESHDIERSSNNERRHVEVEFSNPNIDGSGYGQRSDKNPNSDYKERRNESSNFAGRSMRRFFSDIRSEPGSNRSNSWRPNVKAEEFVPGRMKKLPSKKDEYPSSANSSIYGHFLLNDLLNYDVDLMPSDEVRDYANALKSRILDRILEFELSDREELGMLCEITDGTQTDKNQKIICSRICAVVNKTMPNQQWSRRNNPSMSRYNQQANYRNENHYLDRR